jgi:hydrogenase maturation factor
MHDPTEGGLLQGVWELAEASRVGFTIYESSIPVREETKRVCAAFKLDPLRLMGSGCLLVAVDERVTEAILRKLSRKHVPAALIGTVTNRRGGRKLVRTDGSVQDIGPCERDEIYRVIESYRLDEADPLEV